MDKNRIIASIHWSVVDRVLKYRFQDMPSWFAVFIAGAPNDPFLYIWQWSLNISITKSDISRFEVYKDYAIWHLLFIGVKPFLILVS